MTRRLRLSVFFVAAAGVAALLVWGTAGLPDFGNYRGEYGRLVSRVAPKERQATNTVTATVFDYRGFDTMGEEFILFAAVTGVALLLREPREEERPRPLDPIRSDALRAAGISLAAAVLVLGLWVVAHGQVTPGGGFQGGVVLSAAFLLLWLAGTFRSYKQLTAVPVAELAEGTGAAGYVTVGLVALLLGMPFLHNLLPLGVAGKLSSAGSIPLLNWATALEVTAAFVLLFGEFLDERALVLAAATARR
jgi:multicomponent Na+:H+ antiporter subunit B